MRPLYIFDLDGTLALIGHRVSILEDELDSYRWIKFYAACDKDLPNVPVINTMERLKKSGAEILIFSGRSEEVREKTVDWLKIHTSFRDKDLDPSTGILTMRRIGDYTPDDVLKQSWIDNMLLEDLERLVAVFDDRSKVVNMWRDNGIACFQVASGEF